MRFGIARTRATVRWADEALRELGQLVGRRSSPLVSGRVRVQAPKRRLCGVALALTILSGCGGDDEAEPAWRKIEPGGETACARGGRFAFWTRRADPDKLLIYFQPGGGCFDVRTCAPGSDWFDDSVTDGDSPKGQGGIFDSANPQNPFRDYSVVYIPSCTGDVHTGDNVRTYRGAGEQVTIRHRGFVNARAALEWTFERFPIRKQSS